MYWYQRVVLNTPEHEAGYAKWNMIAQEMLAHIKLIYDISDMQYPYPVEHILPLIKEYLNHTDKITVFSQQCRSKLGISPSDWQQIKTLTDEQIIKIFIATLELIWRRRKHSIRFLNKWMLRLAKPMSLYGQACGGEQQQAIRIELEKIQSAIQAILNALDKPQNTTEHIQSIETPLPVPQDVKTQSVASPESIHSDNTAKTSKQTTAVKQSKTKPQKTAKKTSKSTKNATKPAKQRTTTVNTNTNDHAHAKDCTDTKAGNSANTLPVKQVSELFKPIANMYLPIEGFVSYIPKTSKMPKDSIVNSECKYLCSEYKITPIKAVTVRHGQMILYPVWMLYEAYKRLGATLP